MLSLPKQLSPISILLLWSCSSVVVESKCKKGCPLALASYYLWSRGVGTTYVSQVLGTSIDEIVSYNPSNVPDKDRVRSGTRINIPYSCDCLNDGQFLGHIFEYKVQKGDTFVKIANEYYSNLTTVNMIQNFNSFLTDDVPENSIVKVPVNCSCGNSDVDKNYGLFLTYPLRPEDNLSSVAQFSNSTPSLLQRYNPNENFSAGTGIVFIPAKDKTGQYPPMPSSSGLSGAVIAGISVAVVAVVIMLAVLFLHMRRKKRKNALLSFENSGEYLARSVQGSSHKTANSMDAGNRGLTVDKSVEFSYEELAQATDNFSMANKIGSGGFGDVYYAELRGEKAAIKKMDMQASKEFLAELQVLTRVHHLNLVHLIGYCVEECLFLVYEFIENGNLSQHLRGTGRDPLSWSTRVQIALDSARGLEYIHEHTVPVYIHRDIKSANILIDNSCHAKVADFELTKLTEVGNYSILTRLVGTFGYMPPDLDVVVSNIWAREPVSLERRIARKEKMALEEEFQQMREQWKAMTEAWQQSQETIKALQEEVTRLSKSSKENVRRTIEVDPNALPEKFNTLDIPKFKATDNPLYHLSTFETIMTLKKIDKKLFPTLFPMSLEHAPQQWFCSKDPKLRETWDDVCHLFEDRYKSNIPPEHDLRELSLIKQKKNEGFTEFYGRWNITVANMVTPPTEKESVKIFIENLQDEYQQHVRFSGHTTLRSVYNVGTEIEDYLATHDSTSSGWKGKESKASPTNPKTTHSNGYDEGRDIPPTTVED